MRVRVDLVLQYTRLCPLLSLFHLIITLPWKEDVVIFPILQITKLRLEKIM